MQLTLAIILRELIGQPRHRSFYLRRLFFVLLASGTLVVGFSRQWSTPQGALGLNLFRALAIVSVIFAFFAAPASASTYFAREKEMRTLGLLLIADVSSGQLVFSRFLSTLFNISLICLSVLPMFILCLQMGGLHLHQVLVTFGILLATVCVGSAIGLLLSTMMMDEMTAFFGSLVSSACILITLPGLLVILGQELSPDDSPTWLHTYLLPSISPVYAVLGVLAGKTFLPGYLFIGCSLAATLVVLLICSRLLPRQAHTPQRLVDPRYDEHKRPRRRELRGNPVIWRETPRVGLTLFFFSMTAGILLALPWGISRGLAWYAVGLAIFAVSASIVGLGLLLRGALGFVHEKELHTFELLLITGLSEEDIIMGKYMGYLKTYSPWLLSMLVSFVLMSLQDQFWRVAMAYLLFLTLIFAYFNTALLMSLLCRRLVALLSSLAIFVFWTSLGIFLMLNLDQYVWEVSGIIAFHLVAGCVLIELVYKAFRRLSQDESIFNVRHGGV